MSAAKREREDLMPHSSNSTLNTTLSGNTFLGIWKNAWPMLLIMVFNFLVGLTDVYVAGMISSQVQGAIGFIAQLYFLIGYPGQCHRHWNGLSGFPGQRGPTNPGSDPSVPTIPDFRDPDRLAAQPGRDFRPSMDRPGKRLSAGDSGDRRHVPADFCPGPGPQLFSDHLRSHLSGPGGTAEAAPGDGSWSAA